MHNFVCIKCQFVDCTKGRQQHWQLIQSKSQSHRASLTYLLISQHTEKGRAHTTLNGVPFHGIACLEGLQDSSSELLETFTEVKERFPLPGVTAWLCGWQNHPICKLGLGKLNNSSRVSWQCCPCRNIRHSTPGGPTQSSDTRL